MCDTGGRRQVCSYEPHPDNYRFLRENTQLDGLEKIIPFPVAIAAARGKSELYLWEADSLAHSLLGLGKGNYVSFLVSHGWPAYEAE